MLTSQPIGQPEPKPIEPRLPAGAGLAIHQTRTHKSVAQAGNRMGYSGGPIPKASNLIGQPQSKEGPPPNFQMRGRRPRHNQDPVVGGMDGEPWGPGLHCPQFNAAQG